MGRGFGPAGGYSWICSEAEPVSDNLFCHRVRAGGSGGKGLSSIPDDFSRQLRHFLHKPDHTGIDRTDFVRTCFPLPATTEN